MAEFNKLKLEWDCRRGMLELDNVIMPFYKQHFDSLNTQQKQAFIHLLECSDLELFSWIFNGNEPSDPELRQIILHIRKIQILKKS